MGKRILIVGGVAGGASTAARLRRLDENAEIIMFERGGYISFANCGMPYYLGETIKGRDRLLVQTKEGMEKRFNIDIRVNSEVTNIFRDSKEVEVVSRGKVYRESYDFLVLSPGASPVVPPIPGINRENIYTLRSMEDVDKIKTHLINKKPKSAAVIGGGFIGIEMAENLKKTGIDVTLIEAFNQVMSPLDVEMARMVEKHLIDNDVNLILSDAVEKFEGTEKIDVILKSGTKKSVDCVILSIGVRPETKLAKLSDLELGDRGGIKVDEYMRTSDPNIFALGDAVEVKDIVNGSSTLIPLAGPANKMGRIVADNICGRKVKYNGSQGTSILKIFDLTVASTGNNEKLLKKKNISHLKSYTHSASHAGYYPGAFVMTIKLLFSPEDGRILGSQIVGRDGVDKRIDTLANAVRFNLTVEDLKEMELAYAPPYSSAKDPVNMAGYAASNILDGSVKVIHFDEIENLDTESNFILDVRTDVEYAGGAISGAVNIPVDDLRNRLNEIPRNKKIIVYCKIGLRGYIACRILMENGFDAYNLSGGYDLYSAAIYKGSLIKKLDVDEVKPAAEIKEEVHESGNVKTVKIDACGLQCPGPIMKVYKEIEKIRDGDILEVHVTDPAFSTDIKSWCSRTGNTLIGVEKTCCDYVAYIKKGVSPGCEEKSTLSNASSKVELPQGKTMVVFDGDLDKAIASFIIANGAAAMGRPVTMFFTFWGLNILRKDTVQQVNKTFIEKMLGVMMPRGSKKLKLSNMNMAGIGPKMIRGIMKNKNILSLEELIEQAKKNGVKLMACSMSMDVMGIKKDELIDGIEIGGVATYLGEAEQANVNLFI